MRPHLKSLIIVFVFSQLDCEAFKMPSDIGNEISRRSCAWMARCGLIGQSEEPDCVVQLSPDPEVAALELDEVVAAERATIDRAALSGCLDALGSAGCTPNEFGAASASCAWTKLIKGHGIPGTPCLHSVECATGYCGLGSRDTVAACGSNCHPWLRAGDPCDPALPTCAPDTFCHPKIHRCESMRGEGAACSGYAQCAGDLFCLGYLPGTLTTPERLGQCLPLRAEGAPCLRDVEGWSDCALGLFCDTLNVPATCAKRRGLGQPCNSRVGCQDGLTCVGAGELDLEAPDDTGTCQPVVDVMGFCQGRFQKFDAQKGFAWQSDCPANAVCYRSKDPVSQQWVGACIPSTLEEPCQPLLFKYPDGRLGVIPVPQCPVGTYCDKADRCRSRGLPGQPCTPQVNNPCLVGACNPQSKRCELPCSI